jgi:hypothetical protein
LVNSISFTLCVATVGECKDSPGQGVDYTNWVVDVKAVAVLWDRVTSNKREAKVIRLLVLTQVVERKEFTETSGTNGIERQEVAAGGIWGVREITLKPLVGSVSFTLRETVVREGQGVLGVWEDYADRRYKSRTNTIFITTIKQLIERKA